MSTREKGHLPCPCTVQHLAEFLDEGAELFENTLFEGKTLSAPNEEQVKGIIDLFNEHQAKSTDWEMTRSKAAVFYQFFWSLSRKIRYGAAQNMLVTLGLPKPFREHIWYNLDAGTTYMDDELGNNLKFQ